MSDNPRAHWPKALQDACEAGRENGCVGTTLLSETSKVRIWHLHIAPGERMDFHRHVLSYFWTSLSDGRSRNFFEDGRMSDRQLYKGETMHKEFGASEYMLHSVENIGDTDLDFTTVEFLDGPNEPLPIPESRRLKVPA